jgi:hypothetical protein
MLDHTEEVHTTEAPGAASAPATAAPARGMPSAEPGPVATERARRTGFDLDTIGGDDGGGLIRPGSEETETEGDSEGKNAALGTIIALLVIAALIILNLLAPGE